MPTGYEVRMYEDVKMMRLALQKIAVELEMLREQHELAIARVKTGEAVQP